MTKAEYARKCRIIKDAHEVSLLTREQALRAIEILRQAARS